MELKKRDLKLTESMNRQFLSFFPDKPAGVPRMAWDTCDSYLEMKQPLMAVDPKGNSAEEGTWDEVKDVKAYWQSKMPLIWMIVGIISFTFFLFVYYYWRWL